MAALLPNAKQFFVDANGAPLAGGAVNFYVPGTTTPKDTWQDAAGTILNTNPVILDSSGRAVIYGSGSYRQIVKDSLGNTIWDQNTASSIDSASGGTAGLAVLGMNTIAQIQSYLTTVSYSPQSLTDAQKAQAALNLSVVKYVISRTVLKTLIPEVGMLAYLAEGGRYGFFAWLSGDFSAKITGDPLEGLYVKANSVVSTSGAWVRVVGDFVTPMMWGAAGDGVTDDAAAGVAAMATDFPLYIDRSYATSQAWNYAGGKVKKVYGNGDGTSIIIMTAIAGHCLSKTNGVLFVEGIGITTTVDKSGGTAAIYLSGPLAGRDMVDNCRLYGASATVRLSIGVWCASDVIPTIRSNYILSCASYGILLQNSNAGAGGEAVIMGNTINTVVASPNGASALTFTSGLGVVRVIGNTFQSYDIGVDIQPDSTVANSSALISANSFENNSQASILVDRMASGGFVNTLNVTGNNFQNPTGKHVLVRDNTGTNVSFCRYINITGNAHSFTATGPIQFTGGYMATIDGNIFEAMATGLNAIVFSATAPGVGVIGANVFAGMTSPYALNGNPNITKVNLVAA
ncbi:hypothetical protein ACTJJ7_16235 [Phyllobacterium sp. 22229]|uniref:hypothetical protein n=1 Tax=Phyllobacterium sp. 22229 TaxID=3453895 RepID=UPI003F84EB0A